MTTDAGIGKKEGMKKQKAPSVWKRLTGVNEFGILIALVVLCVVLGLANPVFFTFGNAMNVLRQITLVAIMAVGEAFIIITGGIDLSVGSTMTLSGIMIAFFVAAGIDPTVALVLTLGVGLLCGFCNSLLIVKLNLNAFITTLATMNIIKGFAYLVTGGLPIKFDSYINFIGNGTIGGAGGVPISVIIMFVVVIIGHIVLNRTVFGKKVFAVGGNERAAKLSGIRTERVKYSVYSIAGVLCALAGAICVCNLSIADNSSGNGMEMDVIAAVVIGGASLAGGKGSIIGVLIGAAIMGVLKNGFVLLQFSTYWQMITLGAVIIVAVVLDGLRNRKK